MDIEFDPAKSARNALLRNLPFDLIHEVEWDAAVVYVDRRFEYGEDRMIEQAHADASAHE